LWLPFFGEKVNNVVWKETKCYPRLAFLKSQQFRELLMLKNVNLRPPGAAFFGMLLFATIATHAQTAPPTITAPRTVKVEEPGDGAHHFMLPPINLDVIRAFAERVSVDDRYALTKEPAEIVVFIICFDTRKDERLVEGDFCTYTFEYHSKKAPEFKMPLGTPSPVVGFRASEIAENIFQAFLTETMETKLSVAELEVAFRVAEFCSKRANHEPCSGKLP
jgi:hypothetical protein